VDGRVLSSDALRGDLISPRTTRPSTIFIKEICNVKQESVCNLMCVFSWVLIHTNATQDTDKYQPFKDEAQTALFKGQVRAAL
jgi:hypothetical protein